MLRRKKCPVVTATRNFIGFTWPQSSLEVHPARDPKWALRPRCPDRAAALGRLSISPTPTLPLLDRVPGGLHLLRVEDHWVINGHFA